MIDQQIRELDDASAARMLSLIARAHQDQGEQAPPSRELAGALNEALDGTCEGVPDPGDGEAARLALTVLAQDERFAGPIEAMLNGPPPQRMVLDPVGGTLLAAGILFALQTHFKFERKEDGRWSVKIEKKPTSNSLLTPLVKKLMSAVGL
jgi:hypothetical protein